MNNEIVDRFNDEAREIEAQLEELGQMICDVPRSGETWNSVNDAVKALQKAIRCSYDLYE